MACVVAGCRSHSSRKANDDAVLVSFHRLPTEVTLRQKWIDAIARSNWEWKKQQRVCSKHFSDDCFDNISYKWRRLKSNAVPSLHLPRKNSFMKPEVKYRNESPESAYIPEVPFPVDTSSPPHSSIIYPLRVYTSETSTATQKKLSTLTCKISQLEKGIERIRKVAKRRLLTINALHTKTRSLKRINHHLRTTLMTLLEEEKLNTDTYQDYIVMGPVPE